MSFWKKETDSAEWLAGVEFFDGFTAAQMQRVAALGQEQEADAGALLVDQGDTGVDCYVIVEGTASVYVGGDFITSLAPGTMVGEMSLVGHKPRNATVIADTPMKLIRFDAEHFRQLLDEMPRASERVMALLHERANR